MLIEVSKLPINARFTTALTGRPGVVVDKPHGHEGTPVALEMPDETKCLSPRILVIAG